MSDNNAEDETKKSTPSKSRGNKNAQHFNVYVNDPSRDHLAFIARELVLCTLPHSDPGNVPAWSRTNGNLTLGIQPGFNHKTGTGYGYPYGIIPRLVLVWIVTEILRTKSRRLELGHHLSDFLEKIGLSSNTGRGERGDARRVKNQMERLFNSIISFQYSAKGETKGGEAWLNMQVAPKGMLWWSDKEPSQDEFFGSWIEVGEEFYKAVMANPYPLDIRVLRAIKNSALGIDLYTILNREAYRASKDKKPRFLAWEWLHVQTGNECADVRDFRRKCLVQIEQILEVHNGLIVNVQRGQRGQKSGLVISNLSTPSIVPEQFDPRPKLKTPTKRGTRPAMAIVPPAPTPQTPQLKPATIEEFRRRYPRFDPYVCKYAFDAWLEARDEHAQPKHYDRAFLGFTSKWALNKI